MIAALPTGSVRQNVDSICRFRPIAGGGFRAAVEITRRCNIACLHCFVPNDRREPELAVLEAISRKLQQVGCRKILLTGGEPLLRLDLEKIVHAATAAGVGVDLNSNLVGLSAARADALVAAGLGEASVSFYGDQSFHDAFVRKAGAYESTLHSCRLLRERGVEIDMHGPLWSGNLCCAEHIHNLARALEAESLTFFKVIAVSGTDGGWFLGPTRFDASADQFPPVSPEVIASVIQRLRERSQMAVRTIGLLGQQKGKCEQACSIIGLTADLNLSPCLLSRRRTSTDRRVTPDNVQESLAALRQEVREGLWAPACGIVTAMEDE